MPGWRVRGRDAGKAAAADVLVGDDAEEGLHHIEPGAAGRGEVRAAGAWRARPARCRG